MNVHFDLRCLQDNNFKHRGVGYHSAVLLGAARKFLPHDCKLIGLVDPLLPSLDEGFQGLVDETSSVFAPIEASSVCAFIELSPMTHDPSLAARLMRGDKVFKATIVYDFIPLDVPQRYLATAAAEDDYAAQLGWLQGYNHYFPISKYSSARLQELLPIPRSNIDVTGVALREPFEKRMEDGFQVANRPANIKLPKEYVLCVAGGDPRKNVEVLIQAHGRLRKKLPNLHLIIVGNYGSDQIAGLETMHLLSNGNRSRLEFRRGITDDDLEALYRFAKVSVSCSKIEGFSLPVIEAIACGCPMLVSDNAAHRELIQDENNLFHGSDIERLSVLIHNVVKSSTLRRSMLDSQIEVPKRFTARKVTEAFWVPICRGIRQLKLSVRKGSVVRERKTARRPRLAILSPFPPDSSGVADYTRRTVQSLGKLVDVDVFTDASIPMATPEVKNFFPISEIPYTSGVYDSVLAVVGNSHFHTKIIEQQRRYGGPCLIHDNRLAELYVWWKGADYLIGLAKKYLKRCPTVSEVEFWVQNPGNLPSIFFGELIDCSKPLIVHSRGIQQQCFKEHGVEPVYLPFSCYRVFDESKLSTEGRIAARQRLQIPLNQLAIISLGIVAPSKGPEACIESIKLLKQQGIEAHFYFVGSSGAMRQPLMEFAKEESVETQIHFTADWVDERTYQDYVLAADAAIQLRNHFFGGLSGAMLDCIASGLTTVANDDLAEALDSPSFVLRVSDQLKPVEIAGALATAIWDRSYLNRLHPSRRLYLEEHSFDRYAEKLLHTLGLNFAESDSRNNADFSLGQSQSFVRQPLGR